jgi:hypothetical protein
MQVIAQAMPGVLGLPMDVLGEIVTYLSLADLYNCSRTNNQFAAAFHHRCRELGANLIAGSVFSTDLLLVIARFMWRVYYEWTWPLVSIVIQNPNALQFYGPDAHDPFPALRFTIDPSGNIFPWHAYDAQEPYHANLTSGTLDPEYDDLVNQGLPLRYADHVKIYIPTNDSRAYLEIRIYQRQWNRPMMLFIHVSAPDIHAYPAYCGALIFLFFSLRSDLSKMPRLFQDCVLRVRIMLPDDLAPNAPLNLPPCPRCVWPPGPGLAATRSCAYVRPSDHKGTAVP